VGDAAKTGGRKASRVALRWLDGRKYRLEEHIHSRPWGGWDWDWDWDKDLRLETNGWIEVMRQIRNLNLLRAHLTMNVM